MFSIVMVIGAMILAPVVMACIFHAMLGFSLGRKGGVAEYESETGNPRHS